MKNLMHKEFVLLRHPVLIILPLMSLLLLIPDYPYWVTFFYTCLGIFRIFLNARENHDLLFTAILPVSKAAAIKARVCTVCLIELFQMAFSIPFAIISLRINAPGNAAGMDANVAFFGLVFLFFGIFNLIFLPVFYRSGYKAGVAFLWGAAGSCLFVGVVEFAIAIVPALRIMLDTNDPAIIALQYPVLIGGAVIWILLTLYAASRSLFNFEKADIPE